jgi:hypothetical protein
MSIFGAFIFPKQRFFKTQKKNIQKNSIQNQRIKKNNHFFFKKHLEVKKKYLPLHSQTETMGLPIGDERAEKKVL